jgi:membrane protein implicated in regulation of membrane protease activity
MCLELVGSGSVLIWIGAGALFCGFLIELLGGNLHWTLQITAFCLFSLVSLVMGRKFIKKARPSESSTLNRRLQQYLGRHSRLREPISNGKGRIKLDDTYWTVHGPDMPIGTNVEVVGVDGSTLIVAKADTNL